MAGNQRSYVIGVTIVVFLVNIGDAIPSFQHNLTNPIEEKSTANEIHVSPSDENQKGRFSGVENFRLPTFVKPKHYTLEVLHLLQDESVDLKKYTSPGNVTILVDVLEDCSEVILHADNLEIRDVQILQTNRQQVEMSNYTVNEKLQFLIISTVSKLPKGEYYIYIHFEAKISEERLDGLYLDYYVDPQTKEKRYMATTLFAPNRARKAFPCFDEPALRATFDISIAHDATKYKALSNMKVKNQTAVDWLDNYTWSHFETSPKMSTYLVAMITTDLIQEVERVKPKSTSQNLTIEAYLAKYLASFGEMRKTTATDRKSWELYMDVTKTIIGGFAELLGEEYVLNKVAAVSLPHSFFNAMENWGLMTFKDPILLTVEGVTTEAERCKVAQTVAHELSHQWFGNLVGLEWWTWIWLNEGFATFFSAVGLEMTNPEYQPWKRFLTEHLQPALDFDGKEVHPIAYEPNSPSAVGNIYTKIPYKKGASVLRMTREFMGNNGFIDAIRLYVQRWKFRTPTEDDLFKAFDDIRQNMTIESGSFPKDANISVKDILKTWTTQNSYPVVILSLNEDSTELMFSQRRFINRIIREVIPELKDNANHTWWIPITMISDFTEGNATDFWLPPNEVEISVPFEDNNQTVIVNPLSTGYYRTLYNNSFLWSRILRDFRQIPVEAQSQIIDDYFHLGFSGYTDPINALNLIEHVDDDSDLVVWESLINNLDAMVDMLRSAKNYSYFQKVISQKLKTAADSIHLSLKSPEDRILYEKLLKHLCRYDPKACAEKAKTYVPKIKTPEDIYMLQAEEQEPIFCAMVASSSNWTEVWNMFADFYLEESFSVLRYRYLRALSCVPDEGQLLRLLEWTTDHKKDLHDVEAATLIQYVVENPLGQTLIIPFLQDNIHQLYKKSSAANPVARAVKAFQKFSSSKEHYDELSSFFRDNAEIFGPGKERWMENILHDVNLHLLWMETYSGLVLDWAKNNYGD